MVRGRARANDEGGGAALEALGLLEAQQVLLPVQLVDEAPVGVLGQTVGGEGVQDHRHGPGLALRLILLTRTHLHQCVTHT